MNNLSIAVDMEPEVLPVEPGLQLTEDLTFEDWELLGKKLIDADKYIRWHIGDWLNYGESRYGEKYAQAIELTGMSYDTLAQCKTLSDKFEITRRRVNLSWSHHREVQSLEPEIQESLMDEAEEEGYSKKDLREAVTAKKRDEKQKEKQEKREKLAEEIVQSDSRSVFLPNILHGDSIELLKTIDSESIDLAVIDPPYNMDKADWDSYGSGENFADWSEQWLSEVHRTLKPTGSLYVFGINRMLSHLQHRMEKIGLHFRSWITWDTIQGAGGGLWVNRTESILYYSKTNKPYEDSDAIKLERHEENVREYKGKTYQFKNPSNIWRFPCVDDKHSERTEHPTQKPVELIERIIKASSCEGSTVLDCFMGSGTTGVAAMKNRRKCIGIEQNPDYVELAKSRFSATAVPE